MIKDIFKQWRVIILILCLFFSYLAIGFNFDTSGVAIASIDEGSIAKLAGMQGPAQNSNMVSRERVLSVNNNVINSVEDYSKVVDSLGNITTINVQTDKGSYVLINDVNNTLGIEVKEVAGSNIRKGLDLQGGTRVLLRPVGIVSDNDIQDIIDVMSSRLNVYGLSDLTIRAASDLEGNKYIAVEIAGATQGEVKDLIAKQGKFEAKIGDQTVFQGGQEDVTFVCRHDGTCSRIVDCAEAQEGFSCRFEFEISLSEAAAKKHASITGDLSVNMSQGSGSYLERPLDLYLDGKLVDSLLISSDLKGKEATRISISGPGYGLTMQDAVDDAVKNRNKLQTVLITGSLPTEVEIIKLDSISPMLGDEFLRNSWTIGLLALLGVAVVIFIRYRNFKIVVPMLITVTSEIFIILGLAALFKYNLDLAAIAGLIAAVGTGVDDQIVLVDQVRSGSAKGEDSTKKAFFIIFAAFAATVAAMVPLFWAGAGLLTGFALVTIAGVTIGVFITRPAFAVMIRVLLKHE